MREEFLTRRVIGAVYEVYNILGHGLPEAVYARALEFELRAQGLDVAREMPVRVRYKGALVGDFRADMLVERRVLLELKATPAIGSMDRAQLLNYLRGSGLAVGLLLHFGPEPEVRRVALGE